jgi:stage II sporulation protein D
VARTGQWNPTSREKRARCGAPVDTWLRQSFASTPRPVLIRIHYWNLLLSILLLLSPLTLAAQTTAQTALTSALQGTPAVGLVVAVKTGRQLASVKAANERHAPGSILKPLFLAAALEQHIVLPETTVFCRRNLHISDGTRDWNLACTHPQSDVAFAAKEALAYSCNRYFAELADRIPPAQAAAILAHYGLAQTPIPQTREQKELLVLGVAGIAVSPAQMAVAYRKLALELDEAQAPTVREGLRDSVSYGMAHNAAAPGMEIAGKTGTASDGPQGRSHGWFAGTGYLGREEVVIVIYLPLGNGADAARLAHDFFLAARAPAPESARSLTVELFSTRTLKTVTATPLGQPMPTQVEWVPDGLRLSSGTTVKQISLSGSFRMRAGPGDPQEILAAGRWTIAWRRDGLQVLLTLPSEDYVIAALNGEAAPDEPMASLKAMAISIRTFALANASRHNAEGFGLCDSTHCQALRLAKARPEVERAVRETAGETLWFGGQRAHVYYTQHCGGMSEAAADVWPAEHAGYLGGHHADPYCLRRSPAEWRARIDLSQLSAIFRAQGWQTPSPISAIRVTRRSASGRAELLEVTGRGAPAELSASSFRFAVDRALGWNQMRSDWYAVSVSGVALEMKGRGYGHGVGLCQAGAYQMAAEGHRDTEILSFYFPGAVAGITPAGDGWRSVPGAGWMLLTTGPASGLVVEGNAAWAKAQSLFGSPADAPTVEELPSTELFRQTTGEPGWMLASTRGSHVFLQPAAVRQSNGGTEALLLHEFLHVLVEQQAGEKAPLWLREGLVETLANSGRTGSEFRIVMPAKELDAALAHPADAAASRQAHQVAARMAALLCTRYGMAAVREFLRNGVPIEVLKRLPSFAAVSATPNGGAGSSSGAQR